MKILTIIPARSGSKAIKNKNIIDLGGKPLIAYTIESALRAKEEGIIESLTVSTDSKDIVAIAQEFGMQVPFLRPVALSGDNSKSVDYVLHAVEYFEKQGKKYDAVMILQPTSPLRTFENIKEAVHIFQTNKNDSLISCYREETINEAIMYRRSGNEAVPLQKEHSKGRTRQSHESIYIRNGAIYITKVGYLKKKKKIISTQPVMYVMKKGESINLDTEEDLEILRSIV